MKKRNRNFRCFTCRQTPTSVDSLLCFVKPQDGGDSTEPLGDGVVMGADVFFFHGLVEKRGAANDGTLFFC